MSTRVSTRMPCTSPRPSMRKELFSLPHNNATTFVNGAAPINDFTPNEVSVCMHARSSRQEPRMRPFGVVCNTHTQHNTTHTHHGAVTEQVADAAPQQEQIAGLAQGQGQGQGQAKQESEPQQARQR